MHIKVLAVGTKMPQWVAAGVDEYQKRLPREWRFSFKEISLGQRSKSQDAAKAIEAEADELLKAIAPQEHVVALDVLGKSWSTEALAQQMANWQMQGVDITLLIGGPDGLSPRCLARANQRWSLSALTLPHPLVRVLLVEQLYRAWTVNNHHPYHK